MEKQEIRTFGRRHGKKLSTRQSYLIENILPQITPANTDDNPILEIGFGAGEHVRDLAVTNPDKIIIGAEPFMNGVASLMSAITDEKTNAILPEYQNIRIWADDVRDLLRGTTMQFEQIWVLHPDPWPKAKHEKRRLLNAEFLLLLGARLAQNGQIIIGTDHWEYFDWILEQVSKTNLSATIADIETIKTRYQTKNKAGTAAPKYLILSA
ncbi:MAG: tRNA (guanosine(46)-N7)-methyltransferase TrmB [Alphaproteobacteria bacterium]|nr:tRNA (guanosine(46)-N7)-methyltransferase TrmB [Alphaproteobacteria bacterium]